MYKNMLVVDMCFGDLPLGLQMALAKVHLQYRYCKGDLNPGSPVYPYKQLSRRADYFKSLRVLEGILTLGQGERCDSCAYVYHGIRCICEYNPMN